MINWPSSKLKTVSEKDISKSIKRQTQTGKEYLQIMYQTKVLCTGYIKNCQNSTARKQMIQVLNG